MTGAAAYLSHTAWYARVAAAACLEGLARLEYGTVTEEPAEGQEKGGSGGGGDTLTNELARGWVGLGDVRLAEVLEKGALLLSHGEDVRNGLWWWWPWPWSWFCACSFVNLVHCGCSVDNI